MRKFFAGFKQYPSAIVGLIMIVFLVGISIYVVISIPYSEAIRIWRGGEDVIGDVPRTARPIYTNWFTARKLPETMVIDSANPEHGIEKTRVEVATGMWDIQMVMEFDYPYDDFPQELQVVLTQLRGEITFCDPDLVYP
jgi:peptide/nickel transport system permease protein